MVSITQYQNIGQRDYQEDRVVVIPKFGKLDHFTLCLVCDGHGGDTASTFLIDEYPKQLSKAFDQYREARKNNKEQKATDDSVTVNLMGLALERCILMWDRKCFGDIARDFNTEKGRIIFGDQNSRKAFFAQYDLKKLEKDGLLSGSTITCMMIDFKKCRAHIINLGDSRTTWIIGGADIGQTIDRTVTRELEDANGVRRNVYDGRVEGLLAMTHAFGDNTEPLLGKVQRDYEKRIIEFGQRGMRAVVGSDGLFDHRSNHQLLYDTFDNANAVAEASLAAIAENESFKRAELVENGLMSMEASETPYVPQFADNTSFIYIKIPAGYVYKQSSLGTTQMEDDSESQPEDITTLIRSMKLANASTVRKSSIKKTSRKKENNNSKQQKPTVVFLPRKSR